MKRVLIEYKRYRRIYRAMDGEVDESVRRRFVGSIDDEVLKTLHINQADLKKFADATPGERIKIVRPYLDRFIEGEIEEKRNLKRAEALDLAGEIGREIKIKRGWHVLPADKLLQLVRIDASLMLKISSDKAAFYFPFTMLNRVLSCVEKPQVGWDPIKNILIITTQCTGSHTRFTLISQPADKCEHLNPIKIALGEPARSKDYSLTDILLKAAESLLGA